MISLHRALLVGVAISAGSLSATGQVRLARTYAATGEDVGEVLRKARAAVGHAKLDGGRTYFLEGTARRYELDGRYRLWFTAAGQFERRIDSKAGEVISFDGKTCWSQDRSGCPRIIDLGELESAQTLHWVQTGRWLAENGPVTVALAEKQSADGPLLLSLRLKGGVVGLELSLDRATYLPVALERRARSISEKWTFEKYKEVLGVQFAQRITQMRAGMTDVFEVSAAGAAPAGQVRPFEAMPPPPKDTRFNADVSARVEVKRGSQGHVYVRPKINDVEAGWFALDSGSGAGMTILAAEADRLKMPAFGKVLRGGAGKLSQGALRSGMTFELGPITIKDLTYVEMPAEFGETMRKATGYEVVGTCGYDFFARGVVELDFKELAITVHDPEKYRLAAGEWQPILFSNKIPCLHCKFEEKGEGIFQLDTGAGAFVLVHSPAVESLNILNDRKTTAMKVGGVGGSVDARFGKLASFEAAGRGFKDVTTLFIVGKEGALADPYTTGTFGGVMFAPATIVFDYPHRRLAIK